MTAASSVDVTAECEGAAIDLETTTGGSTLQLKGGVPPGGGGAL